METPGRYLYLPPAGDDPVIASWPADAERASRAMTLLKLTAELARQLLANATPLNDDALTCFAADADALADALRALDAVRGGGREDVVLMAARPAGARGIWQLAGVQPFVAYGGFGDGPDQLDLSTAENVLIIHLPHDADTTPGLTTILPEAGYCRVCGCSEGNTCTLPNGGRCGWVEATLCSRCAAPE